MGGLQSQEPRQCFKGGFIYLFTFPNVSNAAVLVTIVSLQISNAIFVNVLILDSCYVKTCMNKTSVKYLQGININQ